MKAIGYVLNEKKKQLAMEQHPRINAAHSGKRPYQFLMQCFWMDYCVCLVN
jgi:hypothetical protein